MLNKSQEFHQLIFANFFQRTISGIDEQSCQKASTSWFETQAFGTHQEIAQSQKGSARQ
jgi:hypothetical protein